MHFNRDALLRRARAKLISKSSGWETIVSENDWFQQRALRALVDHNFFQTLNEPPSLLAYSYAARVLVEAAKENGATVLLAQIDGGEADENLISQLQRLGPKHNFAPAPATYWEQWRSECSLADRIIVNSNWSKDLLIEAGVPQSKLVVVPIPYVPADTTICRPHSYPGTFNPTRPLSVLYLGAATPRKGILETLEAARLLSEQPVVFSVVGKDPGRLMADHGLANVKYHGVVPRERVHSYYANADLFLFPTHSDGFGMTQIEALTAGLPVIASRNCAELVEHGRTGLLLPEVSALAIKSSIEKLLASPQVLSDMSHAACCFARSFAGRATRSLLESLASFNDRGDSE